MKRTGIALLLVFLLTPLFMARGNGFKNTLEKEYKHRVLALRTPFQAGEQEFDSSGNPLTSPPANTWRAHGAIQVEKMKLEGDSLLVEGPPIAFGSPPKKKKNQQKLKVGDIVELGKRLAVRIHLDRPPGSADELRPLLDHVFFLDDPELQHARPEYVRPDEEANPEKTYRVLADKVKAPVVTYAPDPDYSDEARHAKYQGTVILGVIVDKDGRISKIRIERALGMGLDASAVEKVKTWRFDPGVLNGQPVAVAMSVEVSFNLY